MKTTHLTLDEQARAQALSDITSDFMESKFLRIEGYEPDGNNTQDFKISMNLLLTGEKPLLNLPA